jgi:putative hydrolase of the HAD superfamily
LPEIKAVITDYIGTLANARNYSLEASTLKLHKTLTEAGFETRLDAFLAAYNKAHEKYRVVRYRKLREVTNAVWVSEALNALGYETSMEDSRIKAALNIFFQDYVDSLELRRYAKSLIRKITENCKLGLVSNFTYAPVIYASLRKLGINQFFNAIVVSEDTGWRKPHKRIFQDALRRLKVTAEETVYIGDSPLEDIEGAKAVGMKTVFVPSQFYSLEDLRGIHQQPDVIAEDLREIYMNFDRIVTAKQKCYSD